MPGEEARAREIVAHLSAGTASSDEVFAAFEELDHMPADIVRRAFEPWTGPAPDLERLDDTMRRVHRLPARTPALETLGSARDADVLDLGALAEAQLRVAGKAWDGQDLEAEERLDGEREDSFAGTLERRVLGEGGRPLFDVVLFGEGSGVIFATGGTDVAGVVVEHRVEMRDRASRAAIEQALAATPSLPPPVSVSEAVTVRRPAQLELGLPTPTPPPVVAAAILSEPAIDSEPETLPESVSVPEPNVVIAAPKKTAAAKKKTAAKTASAKQATSARAGVTKAATAKATTTKTTSAKATSAKATSAKAAADDAPEAPAARPSKAAKSPAKKSSAAKAKTAAKAGATTASAAKKAEKKAEKVPATKKKAASKKKTSAKKPAAE